MTLEGRTRQKKTVAIVGGGAGGEFLRLALEHPHLQVTQVASERHAGLPVGDVHPHLRSRTPLTFVPGAELEGADILVLALPPGEAAKRIVEFEGKARVLVDLSADFRLKDAEVYRVTHGEAHPAPERLGDWVYGLPELHRDRLRGATRIAAAGAFATSVILALYPLLGRGVLLPKDIVITGLMGSGNDPEPTGGLRVEQPVGHPEAAELRQALPGQFPLHLTTLGAPHAHGLLTTAHAWLPDGYSHRDVWSTYHEMYGEEPCVRILKAGGAHFPEPETLRGTNGCDLGFAMDNHTGRVVLISALDPLVKGGAGQAMQCLNIAQGWPETAGLNIAGRHPV